MNRTRWIVLGYFLLFAAVVFCVSIADSGEVVLEYTVPSMRADSVNCMMTDTIPTTMGWMDFWVIDVGRGDSLFLRRKSMLNLEGQFDTTHVNVPDSIYYREYQAWAVNIAGVPACRTPFYLDVKPDTAQGE